jgi:hypothetical protein
LSTDSESGSAEKQGSDNKNEICAAWDGGGAAKWQEKFRGETYT